MSVYSGQKNIFYYHLRDKLETRYRDNVHCNISIFNFRNYQRRQITPIRYVTYNLTITRHSQSLTGLRDIQRVSSLLYTNIFYLKLIHPLTLLLCCGTFLCSYLLVFFLCFVYIFFLCLNICLFYSD